MKIRITYILVLIIISVIGILSLQSFWIYNSYKVNQQQFQKEIDQTLEVAVNKEMNLRYSLMAEFIFTSDNMTLLKAQPDTVNGISVDSLLQTVLDQSQQSGGIQSGMNIQIQPTNTDSMDIPDFVGLDIKNLLKSIFIEELEGKTKPNFEVLDSLLKIELKDRNITSDFYIELLNEKKDSVILRNREISIGKHSLLYSREFPVSILSNSYVRLVFPKQQQIILSKMIGILTVSFALLLIVLLCFIYMLRTIIKQKKLSEIKNDFINNMTHELKTPIATVSAAVESMQNFNVLEDKSKTEKYLDISSKELKRLSGLVEKVLNIAAYEKKKLRLNPEKIDFNELIQNIITSNSIKNSNKKVDIFYKSISENPFIIADRVHLTNIMNNLIDNAIK